VLNEPGLHDQIDRLIATGGTDISATKPSISEAELDDLARTALEQLRAIESIISNSRRETEGYGLALESGAEGLSHATSPSEAVMNLVTLTRAVIAKIKDAERELRDRSEAMAALQHSLSEARIKAETDALTGLSNRRSFERELGASFERCKINGLPLSLAICDADHFKLVNDTFGHVTGDRVLRLIGNVLEAHCNGKGKVARFGGEEFVVLFENVECEDAIELIDAARRDLVARKIVKKESGEPLGLVSFSAGVSTLALAGDPGEMLRIADRALYKAKACGRNQVCAANG
jgi:diguanylate cyclase